MVDNGMALFTDQIDMIRKDPFVAILHLIKFQDLDDSLLGEFMEGVINGGQTQSFDLLPRFTKNGPCTWMERPHLNEDIEDGLTLEGHF